MKTRILVVAIAAAMASTTAFATNGMFPHGFGAKSKGMAGAGSVSSKEALVGATNPASITHIGDRTDLGIELFSPQRESDMTGMPYPAGTYSANVEDIFLVPEFGYIRKLNDNVTGALLVYGSGGMNTHYDCGVYSTAAPGACVANPKTGIDLAQLFISPTVAWDINERNSIGVSLNIAYQRFDAFGLQNFAGITPSGTTAFLTDQGYDDSWGLGGRIGWTGKVSNSLTLGAAYNSRTYMSEFDKYKELFAEQGDLDVPASWNLGLSFQATPKLQVAFDVQHIFYSDIKSIGNPNNAATGAQLGTDNGPGFGWDDMTVFKLGFEYQATNNLALRAGFSHGDQPIGTNDTNFNVLAPGVIEDHATLGFTYTLASGNELTGYYMHAFENSVTGDGSASANNGQKLTMYQDSIGITYSWLFK